MVKKTGSKAAKNSQKTTGKKRGPGKQFAPNNPETGEKDPRINRNGAPRVFPELREMSIKILTEKPMLKAEDGQIVESPRTQLETMLRLWLMSQDFNKQNRLVEIGYGKVPDEIRNRTDEAEFIQRYIHVFTDGEIDRIQNGESGMDILLAKLEETFGQKNDLNEK